MLGLNTGKRFTKPSHRYGDHTVLPATRQRRRSRHNHSRSRYLICRPTEGSRLSQPCARRGRANGCGQVRNWTPRVSARKVRSALTTRPRRHTRSSPQWRSDRSTTAYVEWAKAEGSFLATLQPTCSQMCSYLHFHRLQPFG